MPPQPNEKEMLDLLRLWTARMMENQADLARWAQALSYQMMVGVATCDEVTHYNQTAIGIYTEEWWLWNTLKNAGAPHLPAEVPMPPLFATMANVYLNQDAQGDVTAQVAAQLDCEVAPSGMKYVSVDTKAFYARPCPTPVAPLNGTLGAVFGAAPVGAIAACIADPFMCAVAGVVIGGTAGLLIWLGSNGISKIVTSIFEHQAQMNLQIADHTAKNNADRAIRVNKCFDKQASAIAAIADPAARLAATERIRAACEAAEPQVTQSPFSKSWLETALPLAIVAAIFGGTYLVTRTIDHKTAARREAHG